MVRCAGPPCQSRPLTGGHQDRHIVSDGEDHRGKLEGAGNPAQRRAEQRGSRLSSLPVRAPPDGEFAMTARRAIAPLPAASAATIGKGV